jgi:hypothetical protein
MIRKWRAVDTIHCQQTAVHEVKWTDVTRACSWMSRSPGYKDNWNWGFTRVGSGEPDVKLTFLVPVRNASSFGLRVVMDENLPHTTAGNGSMAVVSPYTYMTFDTLCICKTWNNTHNRKQYKSCPTTINCKKMVAEVNTDRHATQQVNEETQWAKSQRNECSHGA